MADVCAHEVTEADIRDWLDTWDGRNRKNYLASVCTMYGFALKRRLVAFDPSSDIETPDLEEPLPDIMAPAAVKKLLRAAETENGGETIPVLAIQFFAGLRPKEAREIDWRDVNLEEGFIRIVPKVAKMKRQRLVDIPPNLAAWLVPHRKEAGQFWPKSPNGFYIAMREVKARAKVHIPPNAGRHAFASYHLAQNAPEDTAKQLGHTDTEFLFTQYRGLVTTKAANAFWRITPRLTGKGLDFSGCSSSSKLISTS